MKYVAIAAVLVLLVSIAGVGYLYMTSGVVVEATGVDAVEAIHQPDTFAALREQVASGAVVGTAYTTQTPGDASQYQFLTYRLRLNNNSYLDAEMVEIQVTPREGDVLQIGGQLPLTLEAHTSQTISATILSDINLHSAREVLVTYSMWGVPFTIRAAIGD